MSIATLVGIYTIGVAPRWLHVIHLRITLPGLPPSWNDLRIAHLSDFHAGGLGVADTHLRRARQAALDFEPDVIALTGDFYDASAQRLVPELYDGWPTGVPVFGVIGNHDVHQGDAWLETVLQQLRTAGVCVLRNCACEVSLRGQSAWIVGVDDPFCRLADAGAAFRAVPDTDVALLYLAHSPEVVSSMPANRSRLLLCGHTHGGQIRLLPSGRTPFIRLLWRIFEDGPRSEPPLHRGLHWVGTTAVVISDGLGTSLIPVRFRTRPQVVLIELAPASLRAGVSTPQRHMTILNPVARVLRWLS